jgi:hypothetical protein
LDLVHTPSGEWSKWTGYGVIDVAKSLGIADTAPDLAISDKSNNVALNLINAPSA